MGGCTLYSDLHYFLKEKYLEQPISIIKHCGFVAETRSRCKFDFHFQMFKFNTLLLVGIFSLQFFFNFLQFNETY